MIEESSKIQSKTELSMPVQFLKGVGPARAEIFSKLGVETVGDLLEYYPRNWNFLPEPVKINQIKPNQTVTVIGMVESIDYQNYRRQPLFEAMISDDTGVCRIVWFHGGYLRNQLEPGMILLISGKVTLYKHQLQLTNPKFQMVEDQHGEPLENLSGGVYPATGKLSSRQIKRIIKPVINPAWT